MNSAQHSSETNQHTTPPDIAAASREALGGSIDLDPASSPASNQIIQAQRFYDWRENALKQRWHGRVFLNPPGGMSGNRSNMKVWFQHLFKEWASGNVDQAVFLAFQPSVLRLNPEIFAYQMPMICPRQRIRFWTSPEALLANLLARSNDEVSPLREVIEVVARRNFDKFLAGRLDWLCRDPDSRDLIFETEKLRKALSSLQRYLENCKACGPSKWIEGEHGILVPSRSPTHDNLLIYLPPLGRDSTAEIDRFYLAFRKIAQVPLRLEEVKHAA